MPTLFLRFSSAQRKHGWFKTDPIESDIISKLWWWQGNIGRGYLHPNAGPADPGFPDPWCLKACHPSTLSSDRFFAISNRGYNSSSIFFLSLSHLALALKLILQILRSFSGSRCPIYIDGSSGFRRYLPGMSASAATTVQNLEEAANVASEYISSSSIPSLFFTTSYPPLAVWLSISSFLEQ